MFQHRASEFDTRVSAIVEHLQAIERELGSLGKTAGRRASAGAVAAGYQIADAIAPILNEIGERFGRGRRVAFDEAASLGSEAVQFGSRAGKDALTRIGRQARQRPLFTLAAAVAVGVLIGFAARRD